MSYLLDGRIFGLPVWLAGVIVVGGGLVVYLWFRNRSGSSSSNASGTLGQNASTATPDPNIDPTTGVPYSIEEAINPATGLPAYYGVPGTTPTPPSSGPGTVIPTPSGGGSMPSTITIRAQQTSGPYAAWDKTHSGVPIRQDAQQDAQIGLAPFGSMVTTAGPAVAGASDNGSNQWYPIQGGGFISAVDVQGGGFAHPATGTSVRIGAIRSQPTPWWPMDLTQTGRY